MRVREKKLFFTLVVCALIGPHLFPVGKWTNSVLPTWVGRLFFCCCQLAFTMSRSILCPVFTTWAESFLFSIVQWQRTLWCFCRIGASVEMFPLKCFCSRWNYSLVCLSFLQKRPLLGFLHRMRDIDFLNSTRISFILPGVRVKLIAQTLLDQMLNPFIVEYESNCYHGHS